MTNPLQSEREARIGIMQIAADLAQRKPLRSLFHLEDCTHIGHRQFRAAFEPADEACRLMSIRLRDCLDALASRTPSPAPEGAAEPTLPVEIYGKLYEVPIAVQVHIVALHERLYAVQRSVTEESRKFIEHCATLGGGMVNGNILAEHARAALAAVPQAAGADGEQT